LRVKEIPGVFKKGFVWNYLNITEKLELPILQIREKHFIFTRVTAIFGVFKSNGIFEILYKTQHVHINEAQLYSPGVGGLGSVRGNR